MLPSTSFNASEVTLVPERLVALSDLCHVKLLGEGCSAAVSLVVHSRTGAQYALKAFKKARLSSLALEDIQAEQRVMAKVALETWALGLEASWADDEAYYLLTVRYSRCDSRTPLTRYGTDSMLPGLRPGLAARWAP